MDQPGKVANPARGQLNRENCCCFSHSAHWLPAQKKLLDTVANPAPARGLLSRGKKKRVWQRPPPPPLLPPRAFGEKKKKKNRAGGLGPSRVRTRVPTTRRLGQWMSLRKILIDLINVFMKIFQSRACCNFVALTSRCYL